MRELIQVCSLAKSFYTLNGIQCPTPPYSLDLAPSDYYLFRSLQNLLHGKTFTSKEEVKDHLNQFFNSKKQKNYERGNILLPERFVEWAQNEIAAVPDFNKQILFSDEVHFWLNGYVNKQNCRIWSEANPQVYVETPLHPEKLTVWCALWAGGIFLQKR
ncbi:transposable element Tc3 transposase [Trichonephila clavipes]|nr:transposable element Tc3 transposase [Trichonephila clavipes]